MIDEKDFAHAVTMAAAFVKNGDIRLQGQDRKDPHYFGELRDVVVDLYRSLQYARRDIEGGPVP